MPHPRIQPRKITPGQQQHVPVRQKPKETTLIDVHIRSGLEEELFRLMPEDLYRLLNLWAIGQEDVIVRIRRENHETNLVLRGTSNGCMVSRPANKNIKLPLANVMSVEEARVLVLKELSEKGQKS